MRADLILISYCTLVTRIRPKTTTKKTKNQPLGIPNRNRNENPRKLSRNDIPGCVKRLEKISIETFLCCFFSLLLSSFSTFIPLFALNEKKQQQLKEPRFKTSERFDRPMKTAWCAIRESRKKKLLCREEKHLFVFMLLPGAAPTNDHRFSKHTRNASFSFIVLISRGGVCLR